MEDKTLKNFEDVCDLDSLIKSLTEAKDKFGNLELMVESYYRSDFTGLSIEDWKMYDEDDKEITKRFAVLGGSGPY